MMVRDGLTQICNKRKFEEEAVREVARARRYGRPLSLLLFDVDRFKSINDERGHLCGDFVLKEVVRLVSDFFRKEQVFARVGGDEFAVLTPEAKHRRGEDARRAAAQPASPTTSSTTAARPSPSPARSASPSFGPEMKSPEELYEAADRALYAAKRGGRDRVEAFVRPAIRSGRSRRLVPRDRRDYRFRRRHPPQRLEAVDPVVVPVRPVDLEAYAPTRRCADAWNDRGVSGRSGPR